MEVPTRSDNRPIWRGKCPPDRSCRLFPLRCLGRVLLFARHIGSVRRSLHRCFSETPAALAGALLVLGSHPSIQIGLQHLHRVVEAIAEGDAVEHVEQRLVEPLGDAVGLRVLHLGAGAVDALHSEAGLMLVPVMGALELATGPFAGLGPLPGLWPRRILRVRQMTLRLLHAIRAKGAYNDRDPTDRGELKVRTQALG